MSRHVCQHGVNIENLCDICDVVKKRCPNCGGVLPSSIDKCYCKEHKLKNVDIVFGGEPTKEIVRVNKSEIHIDLNEIEKLRDIKGKYDVIIKVLEQQVDMDDEQYYYQSKKWINDLLQNINNNTEGEKE